MAHLETGILVRFLFSTLSLGVILLSCQSEQPPSLAAIKTEIREKFEDVNQLPVEEFADWESARKPVLLVDVREQEEFAISHLQDSVHSQSAAEIRRLYREGDYSAVVVYCSVGYRSAQMAQRLKRIGIDDVFNLEGSIFEWANQGRPVFDEAGSASLVHPYDESWGKLLLPRLRAPIDK